MKLEKLVGDRFKERPADCQVDSHALMIRGGYMKNVANVIYSGVWQIRQHRKRTFTFYRPERSADGSWYDT